MSGVVNDLFSAIVAVAVDRAKRDGLALVKERLEDEVCNKAPVPKGYDKPLLPNTCRLIRTTDLQTLVGQATALRAALVGDAVRLARKTLEIRQGHMLPPFVRAADTGLTVLERAVAQPELVLTKNDVWLIVDSFLNSPWKMDDSDTADKASPKRAVIETAVAVARVYAKAEQMRRSEQPDSPAADLAEVIRLEIENCSKVFPKVCENLNTQFELVGRLRAFALLAVKAVESIQVNLDREASDDLRSQLRNAIDFIFSASALMADAESETKMAAIDKTRAENVVPQTERSRAAMVAAQEIIDSPLSHQLAQQWLRAVALAALDGDAPHLISAIALIGADLVQGCDKTKADCLTRQKVAALLTSVSTFALSYQTIPANASAEERAALEKAQQEQRKLAVEAVVDAAADRRNRAGERVWGLGIGVGAMLYANQRLPGVTALADCVANGATSTTCNQAVDFHAPLGVTWQQLPGKWKQNFPFHVGVSFLDLGNYVTTDQSTQEQVDWKAIFAPGLQLGVPIGKPNRFFVAGFSASYIPHFSVDETTSKVQAAWKFGFFVTYHLSLWDFD